MLNNAITLIVPQDNSTLNLIVASWLLDVANKEYESGVRDGKVVEIVEYQDASGFISRAESLVNDSLSMLDQSMKSSADEVLSLISPLELKVQNKADIQTSISEVTQKISNMTGI
jgi:predicted phage tail protein